LWTESTAMTASRWPMVPVTKDALVAALELSADTISTQLDEMSAHGYITESVSEGETHYELTPVVYGFFEYTFMRADADALPLDDIARLFDAYFTEPGVLAELTNAAGETKMMRVVGYEDAIPSEVRSEIMPYELASELINLSNGGAVGPCSCRHQRLHAGTKACDHPVEDSCMSFGAYAEWMIERGFARRASVDELLALLAKARDRGLIHSVDNVQHDVAFLCNCCACCCVGLRSLGSIGVSGLQPSRFLAAVEPSACTACGTCVEVCPAKALSLSPSDAEASAVSSVDGDRCLGCGVCVDRCPSEAIGFLPRAHVLEPPVDESDKMGRIGSEKGRPSSTVSE